MKLGTKVKCSGYLYKVKTQHVESAYREEPTEHFKFMGGIRIEEDMSQEVRKVEKCDFEGIVVAKKFVYKSRYYELCSRHWEDEDYENIRVSGCDYVDCYQVFFRMGGSRLVPIELCEVI